MKRTTFSEELAQLEARLSVLKKLKARFPLLEKAESDSGLEYLYTKEVNTLVVHVEIGYSCSCCAESTVFAKPYLEADGMKVFSNPWYFTVGQGSAVLEEVTPWKGWEARLRSCNIPEIVIQKVQAFFETHKPSICED